MAKQERHQDLHAKIIVRAWKDESFRNLLMSNPKKALKEYGIELPANVDFKVVCNDATHVHFVLPAQPSNIGELSDRELAAMMAAAAKQDSKLLIPWEGGGLYACGW